MSAQKLTEDIEIYEGLKVSSETVRNVLQDKGYHSRSARNIFFVSSVNKKKLLDFAKRYVKMPLDYWHRYVFTEQSKYNISGSDGN